MQSMGLAPREQSLKQINLLLEVIEKKIPPTSQKIVGSPGGLIADLQVRQHVPDDRVPGEAAALYIGRHMESPSR